jgi:hypothetical protein
MVYSQVNFQKKTRKKVDPVREGLPAVRYPPELVSKGATPCPYVVKSTAFRVLLPARRTCPERSRMDLHVVNQAGEVEGEVQTVGDTEVQTASTTVFVVSVLVAFLTYHD